MKEKVIPSLGRYLENNQNLPQTSPEQTSLILLVFIRYSFQSSYYVSWFWGTYLLYVFFYIALVIEEGKQGITKEMEVNLNNKLKDPFYYLHRKSLYYMYQNKSDLSVQPCTCILLNVILKFLHDCFHNNQDTTCRDVNTMSIYTVFHSIISVGLLHHLSDCAGEQQNVQGTIFSPSSETYNNNLDKDELKLGRRFGKEHLQELLCFNLTGI